MNRTDAFTPRIPNPGYEIWFGTAFDFEQELAVWFRYSTLIRHDRSVTSAIWFSFFDHKSSQTIVRTRGFITSIQSHGQELSLDKTRFSSDRIAVTLDDVSLDLTCAHNFEAESHVNKALMSLPIVKTKSIVVSPFCGFSGSVRIGDRDIRMNAKGCYTHIWGSERVPELYWCFVPRFDNADVGMEFFAVRPKPFLPIIKFITVREGDHLLHQPSIFKSMSAGIHPAFPEIRAAGDLKNGRFELNCRMAEPATAYIYVDPSGSNRFINQNDSSYARLILERDGQRQELISQHRAAVEFHGMKPWGEYKYANPYAIQ